MNLLLYLLKDAQNFEIDDVHKENNERLDCDSDIDRDEIGGLNYACADAKEIKKIYKEE